MAGGWRRRGVKRNKCNTVDSRGRRFGVFVHSATYTRHTVACNGANEGQREEEREGKRELFVSGVRGVQRKGEREFGARVEGEEREEPTNRVKEEA